MCAVMLFSFTACLAPPEIETTTVPATQPPRELPVSGVEGAYKFDEYSDHIVLTQFIGTDPGLYIPDTIKGKPVTEFGTIFKGNLKIKSVIIGANCTKIADNAFENCYNLERFEIRSGVKSIGKLAFFGCQMLRLIYIPECVESIADDAFRYCTNIIICGQKGSEAERFANVYSSIYFREFTEAEATETTAAIVTEPTSEDN